MKGSIYPCLWLKKDSIEAVKFYCSIFKDSKITDVNEYSVKFELNGKPFMALNGNVRYEFNESHSFVIECDTQEEIDYYWDKLREGGTESMCGWLKDKYGVSWQIVPSILDALMSDPQKGTKVIDAFLNMRKFDIKTLLEV